MQELLQLISIMNTCTDGDPPVFSEQQFSMKATDRQVKLLVNWMGAEPAKIEFINGKFYALEHKLMRYRDSTKVISLMYDEDGELFAIMSETILVWQRPKGN